MSACCVSLPVSWAHTENMSTNFKYCGAPSPLEICPSITAAFTEVRAHLHDLPSGDFHVFNIYQMCTDWPHFSQITKSKKFQPNKCYST